LGLAYSEKKMKRIYTCVYRIYVHTEDCHCPLPKELIPFCSEGKELNCRHYKKFMEKYQMV